jgi:lipopolysaccharide export system ATP-binding protein
VNETEATRATAKLIDVRALTKRYGSRTVVDQVSLSVRAGEVVGLLGPNGAGKTTTFYMVVGLVRPNGGHVLLSADDGSGTDITHQPIHVRAREGIGYLAQETSVFRRLSVADNLRLIWEQRGVEEHEQERRLPLLLEEFGLEALAGSLAETLSGGERRRVEIARAIATDPSFLLLDEPFTGIDPIAVADIQEIIRLLRAKGLGILITDHAVRETLAIVDRAYILNRGRIEVSGTAAEVAASPVARQFYLGESFRL